MHKTGFGINWQTPVFDYFWIASAKMDKLMFAEVILMAKKPNKTASGTNAKQVQQQNQKAAQGQSNDTEFAAETDVQQVKKQNQESQNKKK